MELGKAGAQLGAGLCRAVSTMDASTGLVSLQGSGDRLPDSSLSPHWAFLYMEEGFGIELGGFTNHITDGTDSQQMLPPGVCYLRLGTLCSTFSS